MGAWVQRGAARIVEETVPNSPNIGRLIRLAACAGASDSGAELR